MSTTQRLSITQNWQQVSTGNVTLAGCNTAAIYHVYVGEQPPAPQSAFISDPLLAPTEYNFNAPVWVKLNVTNQLDEVDLIVMGAYGHSSLRRFFIGSNTTAMLEQTRVPLLMLR